MQKLHETQKVYFETRGQEIPQKNLSFLNQIKYRISPSTWLSSLLSKLRSTSFATGNVEQLHPCASLAFSTSSKGTMGWVSADAKCGYCGLACSDNSRSTRKSNIYQQHTFLLAFTWFKLCKWESDEKYKQTCSLTSLISREVDMHSEKQSILRRALSDEIRMTHRVLY